MARLSALYADRFTTDELEQLLAFHRTPVSQKLSALMDSADMEKVGELWMMDLMGKVMQDLAAKGITIE